MKNEYVVINLKGNFLPGFKIPISFKIKSYLNVRLKTPVVTNKIKKQTI